MTKRIHVSIASVLESPEKAAFVVTVTSGQWTGHVFELTIRHPTLAGWMALLRKAITGLPDGNLAGQPVQLEQVNGEIVAFWRSDGLHRIQIPKGNDVERIPPEMVEDALEFINRRRESGCVQPPLRFGPVSWTSRHTDCEPWSAADLVEEARRLGWER